MQVVTLPLTPGEAYFSRKIVPVNANFTCSRVAQLANHRFDRCQIDWSQNTPYAKELRDMVLQHRDVRLQEFYYKCVAVWHEHITFERDKTIDQHGSSPHRLCAAAHSSLLPNLKDNWEDVIWNEVQGNISKRLAQRLEQLGFSKKTINTLRATPRKQRDRNRFFGHFTEEERKHLLCRSMHIYHIGNSTIQAPMILNEVDCVLEANMRPRALKLLNRVSSGELSPDEALEKLTKKIQSFYHECLSVSARKNEILSELWFLTQQQQVEQAIIDETSPGPTAKRYASLVLAAQEEVNQLRGTSEYSVNIGLKHFKSFWWPLGGAVRNGTKWLRAKSRKMDRETLKAYIKEIFEPHFRFGPGHPLENYQSITRVADLRRQFSKFLSMADVPTCIGADPKIAKRFLQEIQRIRPKYTSMIDRIEACQKKLKNSILIIRLQTPETTPHRVDLAWKRVNKERIALTNQELRQDLKTELLARRYKITYKPSIVIKTNTAV